MKKKWTCNFVLSSGQNAKCDDLEKAHLCMADKKARRCRLIAKKPEVSK